MKEFIEYIVKNLVDHPDQVTVNIADILGRDDAFLDLIEVVLHLGGELDIQNIGEIFYQQVGH